MGFGSVLVGLGHGASLTGAVLLIGDTCADINNCNDDRVFQGFGTAMIGIGMTAAAIGIPLIVVGATPDEDKDELAPPTGTFTLRAAPQQASLEWTF